MLIDGVTIAIKFLSTKGLELIPPAIAPKIIIVMKQESVARIIFKINFLFDENLGGNP